METFFASAGPVGKRCRWLLISIFANATVKLEAGLKSTDRLMGYGLSHQSQGELKTSNSWKYITKQLQQLEAHKGDATLTEHSKERLWGWRCEMLTLQEYSHISCNFSSLNLPFPAECVASPHNVNLNIIRDDFPLGIAVVTLPMAVTKHPAASSLDKKRFSQLAV